VPQKRKGEGNHRLGGVTGRNSLGEGASRGCRDRKRKRGGARAGQTKGRGTEARRERTRQSLGKKSRVFLRKTSAREFEKTTFGKINNRGRKVIEKQKREEEKKKEIRKKIISVLGGSGK